MSTNQNSALQGNQSIRKIIFTDCHGDATGTWTRLKMVIPNNCFKGCSNLKELNLFYHVTDGTNHYETLSPSDIYVGEHAFDDVHPDFRIVVAPDLYNDPNWSQYKDKIVASDGKSFVAPYRCFIQANGTRATRAISSWLEETLDNGETLLKTIDLDGTEHIYDLSGRMVNESAAKGVYIKNGKKMTRLHF